MQVSMEDDKAVGRWLEKQLTSRHKRDLIPSSVTWFQNYPNCSHLQLSFPPVSIPPAPSTTPAPSHPEEKSASGFSSDKNECKVVNYACCFNVLMIKTSFAVKASKTSDIELNLNKLRAIPLNKAKLICNCIKLTVEVSLRYSALMSPKKNRPSSWLLQMLMDNI
jgi:hypothetical protein